MIDINKDIQYVKGIGPKKAYKLNKLGIFTLKDLIFYFPRQYEDRNNLKKIIQLENEDKATIKAVIVGVETTSPRKGMNITKVDVRDETGYAKLVFFNQEYVKNTFRSGDTILVFGKVKKNYKNIEMTSCEVEHLTNAPKNTCKVMPIYPLTYGVTNKEIISIIKSVLSNEELKIKEYMPQRIVEKYKLCSIEYAVKNIHNPSSKDALKIALYRIVFEEFLILQLGLFMFKNGITESDGIKFKENEKLKDVLGSLPFKLTNAQNRALNEIIDDMQNNKVMNRLVQGDVGSGKTVVALLALADCVLNGYQGALMAPTEILAEQHYISLTDTLKDFGMRVELLVGSLTKKKKEAVLERVKNHEVDILIGTHALIEDKVEFDKLGLVITDEQHRFGVRQRSKLSEKGNNPDILVMTATPIPRTLALILYGDLDISIIDELPPGRQPIETIAVDKSKRDRAYNSLVRKEVEQGRQVYIVCPLVEESEAIEAKAAVDLVEELKLEYFSDLRVGLLHGKMKASEKDAVMKSFKNKELDILVSTTVIEVGVNVPNATLMIIENAERFGLAQLHQLRGRVGRGSHKSYCILIYASKSEVCRQRMSIMEETNDGFKISEKDLEIRGPGEFFGTRQHGLPELKIANIFKHMKILKIAQQEARYIMGEDHNLNGFENKLLKKEILDKFEYAVREISLN
ncbi:ATP-dependent DNA helicase RecG [Romboutsia weinsteinii]|uniref:ATP-dependent DNA helicase RecG n=1 Tax=Romboutsia weinsteinii TaxID=2020949 RepID=A0A371J7P2_9FIRM|nr:ATP-dependent DNA helicase RecG [Romboutsia weinsteinii]RDY28686.1 ATP-dependent DNA helicase RecG [Romboutsia weinsteinii]